MPSPILNEIDLEVNSKRMEATLLLPQNPSIFRQDPSLEVDIAWKEMWDSRPVPVSKGQVLAMGKDPAEAVQIPEDWGYGSEKYFGRVDVFHQIHCLDALRREVHFEHYYGKKYPNGYKDTTDFHRLHVSHCIHLLLQNIMCSANTDIYTHIWTDTLDHAFPDFNIQHQCKSFDKIVEWQSKNAIDEDRFVNLTRPNGYPYRKMTHKFKEIHGWFTTHEDDGDFSSGEIA
ncbi:hypothetical protein PVAG01_05848 [Phlyctema vagabunda]|uniref:Tat pathway signal sequence n=1 Tax=Phlyctema vagabunda TaxID=108571 RepID=A0ABR4PEC7_9HELO